MTALRTVIAAAVAFVGWLAAGLILLTASVAVEVLVGGAW